MMASIHGPLTAVESYLDALVNGDIFAMQDLLSPSLMEKKAPVFESSSSGSMLRARYKNAHSRIVGANTMGDNRVKVDAQIAFESGRSMGVSFVLVNDGNGDYLIDEEVE